MPRQHRHDVYLYDELDPKAQEVARDWYVEKVLWPQGLLNEQILEEFQDSLEERGYPTEDIEFNLGHVQGRGVAFYGLADADVVLPRLGFDVPADIHVDIDIRRNSFATHYSHYNTMDVLVDLYDPDGDVDEEWLEQTANEIEEAVQQDVHGTSRFLEQIGDEITEWRESEEAVAEDLRANNDEFYESGRPFFEKP